MLRHLRQQVSRCSGQGVSLPHRARLSPGIRLRGKVVQGLGQTGVPDFHGVNQWIDLSWYAFEQPGPDQQVLSLVVRV